MPNVSHIPFRIDPELQQLIPPLTEEERILLTESLHQDGCRDPLQVWLDPDVLGWCDDCDADVVIDVRYGYVVPEFREQDQEQVWFLACATCERWLAYLTEEDQGDDFQMPCVLLDGHNRYAICTEHNLNYDVQVVFSVNTREDARVWVIRNQLARRNLSDLDRVALALKLKPMLEERGRQLQREAGIQYGEGHPQEVVHNCAQPLPGHKTRDDLAKTAGVSHRVLVEAETILTQGSPEVIDATRKGELSIHAAVPLTALSPEDQAAALEEARQEAHGKPTARLTQEIVNRVRSGDILKDALAAGQYSEDDILPFMRGTDWKPYHILEALDVLRSFPMSERASLNDALDQPYTDAEQALTLLKTLRAFTPAQRASFYVRQQSDDQRERDLVLTIAGRRTPAPDPQGGFVTKALNTLDALQQLQRAWLKEYAQEAWAPTLTTIDQEHIAVMRALYTTIYEQIRAAHAQRIASYAQEFATH